MSVSVLNPVRATAPRLRSVQPDEQARPSVYRLPPHVVSALQPELEVGTALVGYLVLVPEGVAPSLAVAPTPPIAETMETGGLAVDLELRTARLDGELLDLTYLEFELLAHLTAYPHRVHTRDRLVEAVWGYGHVGDGRTVDVHIARLRRKLGPAFRQQIVTVRRVGYKFVPGK
ncbi:winged helix-turn-helix domain-containing protein [Streptacidiphilus jiangxiensis]|uniref:Transcriptional regulatory protein, C terminal n=1 Tax=Streptacidiphilus jiangxiensis TaxID=235985 RepID=A0A1H7TE24_STRJI|nr:winged helix-turn-helix domain-containing protein [Streptacidiphilus jiangxiensis]SEL82634.1 Transcriptional regulatory protein, C terminal [Streptacidiphilus jiangxiensis]